MRHQAHRFCQVAVIANHNSAVVEVQPTVVLEMHGKIDIRPLFPGHYDLNHSAAAGLRVGQRHAHPVSQEMSEIYIHLGPEMLQGPEIGLLTLWH